MTRVVRLTWQDGQRDAMASTDPPRRGGVRRRLTDQGRPEGDASDAALEKHENDGGSTMDKATRIVSSLPPDKAIAWLAGRAGCDLALALSKAQQLAPTVRVMAAPERGPGDRLTLERMGLTKAGSAYLANLPEPDRVKVVPTATEAQIADSMGTDVCALVETKARENGVALPPDWAD